jgi:hypothetical protein
MGKMDRIAYAPDKERAAIFEDAADKIGATAFIVEKDFWVSWVLEKIFTDEYLSGILCFKGGTSLSKAFRLIERFSEDIDLILSQKVVLGENERLDQPSNTKQARFNKEVEERAVNFISSILKEKTAAALGELCHVSVDAADGHILHVRFPKLFDYAYINPDVKLEVGPLSLWNPNEKYPASSYVADAYPELKIEAPLIPTVKPERTFWEKITILHREHYRPESSPIPPRYSRHYYDVYKIGRSCVKDEALKSFGLLREVVDFKKRFYPCGWASYDKAREGFLRLYPGECHLAGLGRDYVEMGNMIFGAVPEWGEILRYMRQLEDEIRGVYRA